MDSNYPFAMERLDDLLNGRRAELPPGFIERLEPILRELRQLHAGHQRAAHLRIVPPPRRQQGAMRSADAGPVRCVHAEVSMRTLQGLEAIFEILHAAHLARLDGDPEGVLSEHLIEGLIVSGRALVRSASWRDGPAGTTT